MTTATPGLLFEAAMELERLCREAGWSFCFIGGLAVLRWSEPRQTTDIDLCVLCDFGAEGDVSSHLLGKLSGRIPDAGEFARINRVLLVKSSNGVSCDVSLGGIPFEEEMIRRASPFIISEGVQVTTCSAEDLVILKVFAGRPKDWGDVDGALARCRGRLDIHLVRSQLAELCEGSERVQHIAQFEQMLRRHGLG